MERDGGDLSRKAVQPVRRVELGLVASDEGHTGPVVVGNVGGDGVIVECVSHCGGESEREVKGEVREGGLIDNGSLTIGIY